MSRSRWPRSPSHVTCWQIFCTVPTDPNRSHVRHNQGLPLTKADDGTGASKTRPERQLFAPTRPHGTPFHDFGEAVVAKRSPLASQMIFSHDQPSWRDPNGEYRIKHIGILFQGRIGPGHQIKFSIKIFVTLPAIDNFPRLGRSAGHFAPQRRRANTEKWV